MMKGCSAWQTLIWSRADADLEPEVLADLDRHQADCDACRAVAEAAAQVGAALALAPDEEPPGPEILERVRNRLAREQAHEPDDVLSPHEVAALLKVPVETVQARLDELPAFEFAGRIRFRRQALERWMEEQEARWRRQNLAHAVRSAR